MTTPRISKVLIANRSEIASRIIATCDRLGIESVAIYSDADARSPFVRQASQAFRIGEAPSAQSYLSVEKILAIAERAGVDAIHPGYGFLAENAGFARAVRERGLVFVGPRPEVIAQMGDKVQAKELARAAGLPLLPSALSEDADAEVAELMAQAAQVGFPLLVKASAGGGGKGMRRVDEEGALEAAILSAKREALAAFGDDRVFLERLLIGARHIEVQIAGDEQGQIAHLFERECSIQRRHQKVIEEAPAPRLDETLRAKIHEAAIALGRSIAYTNVGTVELLVSGQEFFFLEMNTRLQVEHRVSEAITGIDLVELQLQIAEGAPLPPEVLHARARGHAIEARLYAEDVARGSLPSTGELLAWSLPSAPAATQAATTLAGGAALCVDHSLAPGVAITPHYDPMLAKIVAAGSDRASAQRRMLRALKSTRVAGLHTNLSTLIAVIGDRAFTEAEVDTRTLEAGLDAAEFSPSEPELHAALAQIAIAEEALLPPPRWAAPPGFRNNWIERARMRSRRYRALGREVEIRLRQTAPARWAYLLPSHQQRSHEQRSHEQHVAQVIDRSQGQVQLELEGRRSVVEILRGAEGWRWCWVEGIPWAVERISRFPAVNREESGTGACAPMPGKVLLLHVESGAAVREDAPILTLEAMKMEHVVRAKEAGIVRLLVREGAQVEAGERLFEITPSAPEE